MVGKSEYTRHLSGPSVDTKDIHPLTSRKKHSRIYHMSRSIKKADTLTALSWPTVKLQKIRKPLSLGKITWCAGLLPAEPMEHRSFRYSEENLLNSQNSLIRSCVIARKKSSLFTFIILHMTGCSSGVFYSTPSAFPRRCWQQNHIIPFILNLKTALYSGIL